MDDIACKFRVIASNQGWVRAPFEQFDHSSGVPYTIVPKGLQKHSEQWLKGDHKQWEPLNLPGDKSELKGINMDWQLPNTVSLFDRGRSGCQHTDSVNVHLIPASAAFVCT